MQPAVLADIRSALSPSLLSKACSVAVVGSVAESLASDTSDLDLFVVLRPDVHIDDPDVKRTRLRDGKWIDPMVMTLDDTIRLQRLSLLQTLDQVSLRDIELCYKTAYSTLISGEGWYRTLLDSNFDYCNFETRLVEFYTKEAIDAFDDLLGEIADGHADSALEFARDVVRWCVDAALVRLGDGYPKPKWRIKRAARSFALYRGFYGRYRRVEFASRIDSLWETSIEQALLLSQDLQFLTWVSTDARQDASTKPISAEGYYERSPWSLMLVGEREVFVRHRRGHLALDRVSGALLLLLGQRRTLDETIPLLNSILNCTDIRAPQVSRRLNAMEAIGLIRRTTASSVSIDAEGRS